MGKVREQRNEKNEHSSHWMQSKLRNVAWWWGGGGHKKAWAMDAPKILNVKHAQKPYNASHVESRKDQRVGRVIAKKRKRSKQKGVGKMGGTSLCRGEKKNIKTGVPPTCPKEEKGRP